MLLGGCRPTVAEFRSLGEVEREALVAAGRELLTESIAAIVAGIVAGMSTSGPTAPTAAPVELTESDAILQDLAAGMED